MMRLFFTIVFSITVNCCLAQYYAVNDKDSFVNVRVEPKVNAKVLHKLSNETIVYASYAEDADEKSNWLHVDFYLKKTKVKKDQGDYTPEIMKDYTVHSGYIYKTKLSAIEKLKSLKSKQFGNGYTCLNDSVKIKVTIAPFVPSKHTLQYSKEYESVLEKVDKLPMIGTDSDKPNFEITGIKVSINNVAVKIPASAYKNLFNPSLLSDAYANKNGTVYLVMYNSDAAGSYSCIFVFKNGKFIQRLVFTGEC